MVLKKITTNKQVDFNQSNLVQDLNVKGTKAQISNKTILLLVALLGTSLTSTLWFTGFQGSVFKEFICWSLYKDKLLSEYIKDYDVVSCYYNLPDPRAPNSSQLMPANIHPHLCTHINIAFAQIKNKQIYLEDSHYESLRDVVKIKKNNPNLKILLSVGGAGSHNGFSEMVINHAARKTFIRSIKNILKNFSLDGIDLDWEFPAVQLYQNKLRKRERQHFSQLLREIKAEYMREKKDYLLTVAVAAPQIIVDVAYDVDQINMYTDYVNIMTYDFHSYTKFTPFTGLNSPIYARPGEELYFATLNINYTVQMYKDKGLDPKRIVVGIPTYGHSFTLVNTNNTKIGSPASGFGTLGSLGFVNYPDICVYLREYENKTVVKQDIQAQVPYLYNEFEWVSFDNTDSVIAKAKYIKDNKLRGAMIYSLNADDYNGVCEKLSGKVKFPLSISVKNTLDDKQAQSETYCIWT